MTRWGEIKCPRCEMLEEHLCLTEEQLEAAQRDAKEAEAYAEELEAENRLLRDAVYIDDLTVTMQANDRSKAVTVIGRALGFLDADMPTEAKTALRTTLAELTGGKE